MGYSTNFTLEVQSGDYKAVDVCKVIYDMSKASDAFYPLLCDAESILENWYKDDCEDTCLELWGEGKWYQHEEEMKELSKLFQDVVFKLHGEGEENGDVWDKYFKGGKMKECHAVMTIEPYNDNFWVVK